MLPLALVRPDEGRGGEREREREREREERKKEGERGGERVRGGRG